MSSEGNGYKYRLDEIGKSVSDMHDEVRDLPVAGLTSAIEKLTEKIETLTTMHLKIIYWLLILVSTVLVGTKGVELYKIATTVSEVK